MEPKKEKVFADGLMFKRPRDGAPDFVKGSISIKVDSIIPFIQKYAKNGWVNLDLKVSAGGKFYFELNTWEPKKAVEAGEATKTAVQNDVEQEIKNISSGIPF